MALLFIDSFDHYQTTEILAKWTSIGAVTPGILAGVGRCNSQALVLDGVKTITKGVAFGSTTGIIGFALNVQLQLFNPMAFAFFGSADGSQIQVLLARNQDGSIAAYRADPGNVLLGTSAVDILRDQTYYYVEALVTVSATVGVVTVRVNGVTVLNLTGVNTHASLVVPSTTLTNFGFVSGASHTLYFDDVYALNTSGPAPWNTFLGDVKVEYLRPAGAGFHQDWAATGAVTHWQAVDDNATPDGDTSYLSSATIGLTDTETYLPTGLPSGTIFGLQLSLYTRKTDSGGRLLAPVVRLAGVDHVGSDFAPSFPSYSYGITLYQTSPATGVAWTIPEVNAIDAGLTMTA